MGEWRLMHSGRLQKSPELGEGAAWWGDNECICLPQIQTSRPYKAMPGMKERKGLLSPALQQAGPAQIPRITVHLIQQKRGRQTSVPSADFHAMKSRGIKGKIGANVRDSGIRVKRIKISRISHGRMGTERTKEKEKNKTKHCDYLGRYVNVGSLHLKLIECYMLSRRPFKKKNRRKHKNNRRKQLLCTYCVRNIP